MSSLKVHPLLIPFGLPSNIEPTRENITNWIGSSKNMPGLLKISSPADISADIALLAGIVTWIAGIKKDSAAGKWIGKILTIGGAILGRVTGIKSGVAGGLSTLFSSPLLMPTTITHLAGITAWIYSAEKDYKAGKWIGGILTFGALIPAIIAGVRQGLSQDMFSITCGRTENSRDQSSSVPPEVESEPLSDSDSH